MLRKSIATVLLAGTCCVPLPPESTSRADDSRLASLDLRSGEPAMLGTLSDPACLLPPESEDPLLDVSAVILARILPAEGPTVATSDPDYCEEWQREIRPRLQRFWDEIPKEDRLWMDLDGDGTAECVVIARDVAKTNWNNDFRFVAVLRRASDRRWAIAGFARLESNELVDEVVAGDFDGDARPEVAVRTTLIGGWTWTRLIVFGASALDGATSPFLCGRMGGRFRVLPRSAENSTPLFLGIQRHLPLPGEDADRRNDVITREVQAFQWSGSELERVGEVYLPARD